MIELSVKNLQKSFGHNTIFSEISFSQEGTSLAIAGSNGAGKSTFLKCLGGLLRPDRGSIQWRKNQADLPIEEVNKKMGYAAPYINLYDELSCEENLDFLSRIRSTPVKQATIQNWIARMQLSHVSNQPFGKLSTGQQQRLRLAAALFHDPHILMLDEPGSNLDEEGRSLIEEVAESFQQQDKLLIIASNDPNELELCKQIYSIERQSFQ